MSAPTIPFKAFMEVDVRAGTVVRAEPFPEARKPAIQLWIDFGGEVGIRKSSAQIADHYTVDGMVGRQVVVVVNFVPRQIGPFTSQVLTLGLADHDGAIALIAPDRKVPDGARMR